MKHTQGKWIGRQKRDNNIYEYIVYAENGRRAIAEIDGENAEENKANALLIAAAPDLLAACKEAHSRGAHKAGKHNTGKRPDICWLCAAITKAEGK